MYRELDSASEAVYVVVLRNLSPLVINFHGPSLCVDHQLWVRRDLSPADAWDRWAARAR